MKAYLDGDALCITHDDFVNLQESGAFFVKLTSKQIKEFKLFRGSWEWVFGNLYLVKRKKKKKPNG